MIKPYSKDSELSYTEGFFPTFEMLLNHKEDFIMLYVSSDAITSEGFKKIQNMVPKDKIIVSDKAFSITKSKGNAHVLGVFKKFDMKLSSVENHLVMVNPSDMGNLGNAMRTLLAFGYHDLAIIEPAADIFNPKTVRASMGALFKIRVETFKDFDSYIQRYPREYYPFVLQESTPLNEMEFISPCALVFGNEATGLPTSIRNSNNVRIEQSDEVDSLNLTTSIAIGLYKLKMQK